MKKERIEELIKLYRDGLLDDTIPFWLKNAPDKKYGGFLNYLDRRGKPFSTVKPVWVQGRFTWLLSTLYDEVSKTKAWLDTARSGIEFLEKYCFDTDGRMFFEVQADGRPIRKRRYLFSETFAVIAFARYGKAAKDQARIEKAISVFKTLLHYYHNPELLPSKFIPQNSRSKMHAMPMIILATAQQLRHVWDDELVDNTINECMREVFDDFMKYDLKALLETVAPNGEILEGPAGRCVNPGHAIETSWFIMEEYRHQHKSELLEKALEILDWSLDIGWDKEFGGLLYFVDIEGKPTIQYEHDMKLWWPHTEALYATLLAYHLTGQTKYEQWYEKLHEYSFTHFPDPEYGDWIKYLHRDGTVSTTLKGNGWGGPFHLPRMQLKCWQLLEEMKKA